MQKTFGAGGPNFNRRIFNASECLRVSLFYNALRHPGKVVVRVVESQRRVCGPESHQPNLVRLQETVTVDIDSPAREPRCNNAQHRLEVCDFADIAGRIGKKNGGRAHATEPYEKLMRASL